MEAERVFGGLTLGFGQYPFHVDASVCRPTMRVDGALLLERGQFVADDVAAIANRLLAAYAGQSLDAQESSARSAP